MSRWPQGAQEIEQLLARRHLEQVRGARTDGTPWLDKARRRLETADAIAADDPEPRSSSPTTPPASSTKHSWPNKALRPTQSGGHLAVSDAMRAQSGGPLSGISALRRRRNELDRREIHSPHSQASEET